MLLDPVFRLRPGRSMPRAARLGRLRRRAPEGRACCACPAGRCRRSAAPQQVVPLVLHAAAADRRSRSAPACGACGGSRAPGCPASCSPSGMFSLGIMPQALQRPDTTHLAWVSCVPLVFLPATIAELWRHLAPRPASGATPAPWPPRSAWSLLLAVIPYYTYRTYFDLTNQSLGRRGLRPRRPPRRPGLLPGQRHGGAATRRSCVDYLGEHGRAGRAALRRHGRHAQDAVLGRLPVLPAARPDAGHLLHRDGPRHGQPGGLGPRRRRREQRLARPRPTSGTCGTSRTRRAS